MINYTDIIREAYEDNHINFMDYFHSKEKKSIINQRIEVMYFEWFLAKAQVIERDFFINIDTFIPNCLNQCTIVIRGLSATNEKDSMIVDLSFMLLALGKMNKTMDEAEEQGSDIHDFDSNDKTNPLIFDMDLITGLHNNFRSYIFETTDIDTFKNYFRKNPMQIKKRDGVTISELCYLFGKIESKQTGVSNFAEWMKNHIGKNNYGNKKNEFIEMDRNARAKRNGFSLTAPQEKSLENKEKIDKLYNQMQPD